MVRRDAKRIASRNQIRKRCPDQKRRQQLMVFAMEAPHRDRVWTRNEVRQRSGDPSLVAISIGCRSGLDVAVSIGQRGVNTTKTCLLGRVLSRVGLQTYKPLEMWRGLRLGNAFSDPMGDRATIQLPT